jgi:AraC family transcriptional regulator, dual regulator of chb operon
MRKILWKNICRNGEVLHASLAYEPTAGSWQIHVHDFYEIFWVETGMGNHLVGNSSLPQNLISGHLCFIREKDIHGFSAKTGYEPFSIINIAFGSDSWLELSNRYALDSHPFFNTNSENPPLLEVPVELKKEFSLLFRRVLEQPPDLLTRDYFILSLATLTNWSQPAFTATEISPWLHSGLIAFEKNPSSWSGGSAALARYCGCSPTHLARMFHLQLGKKPTQWIVDLRLTRASRLLCSTGLSITEVALESGFNNISHFHRCFSRRFGQTPFHYRKTFRSKAI